ncbi:hypothetical protein [Thalassotalea sp. G2M2-11]|uniref:hypothetical protein n=1 Tax=Thalassotalea sp. G2M2-11 TaxID=2787627 RepID=UPI0019D2CFC6|nr:hypothetical protein [Thalassotalea sp. G2M2-11]
MNKIQTCAVCALSLFIPSSFADITLNGFASIRGSQANSDGGLAPFPEFKEGEVSFKSESLFAIQARADLGEGLSATVQLFAEGRNDFDVNARWAYISYEVNDAHQVSVGRFANPLFHQSQYEKVGFAHNFSRLPKAVYSDFEFATIEGITLDSTFDLDDYTLTTKLLYGSWNGQVFISAVNDNVPLGFKDIYSVNATLSGDWWKIFAGILLTELDGAEFDQGLFQVAAPGVAAAMATGASAGDVAAFNRAIGWDQKDGIYTFAGFGIDYNDWLVDFEYSDYGVDDSTDGFNNSWYLAIGRRFDQLVVTIHTEDFAQETDLDFLDDVSHPVLQATGQAIHEGLIFREYEGSGITIRYDFHPSAAFKVDYFKGEDTRASVGDYSIMSAGIDIVF